MWNSAENVFARSASFREVGEDEEALRWAALERLPTYARARRGIFRNVAGGTMEIDVGELEAKEQKLLLDRLISSADDDPEQFFNRMRRRFDAVRLNFPKIEVRFQNVKVETFVHVGSRALPTIPNFVFNMTEVDVTIGCTKLRKDYATIGSCRTPGSRFAGNVTYNGHRLKEFVPQRTSAYVSQQDWHAAEMTVRETLEFAGRCQGVGFKYELARREKRDGIKPDEDLDIFMKSLALGGQETSLTVEYIMKLLLVAMVTMSVFFRSTLHHNTIDDGGLYLGALYFSMVIILFNGFMEVSMLVAKLPVLYKHRDLHFYPSWVYTIPSWALSVPNSFIESGLWVAITYYVIGFDPSITRFCGQFLIYFLLHQMSVALFRLIGSLGRNMIVANTFGSFAMLVVMGLGGYVISRDRVPKWWIWGFWVSPLMYAQNAASVNEFLGHKWDKRVGNETIPLGEALLRARSLFPQSYWYWIGAGALLGYTVLFNVLFTFFLAYLNPLGKRQAVVTKDELQDRERRRKGDTVVIELRQYLQHSESLNGKYLKQRGMVLPFQQLSMSFSNINYYVDVPQELKQQGIQEEKLQLLSNVTGTFRPGVLTALVGVSGAGKTTLMDVLAGRKTGGMIEGSIHISGYPKRQETFARISGYCEQSDIHSPCLTVLESLLFSVWLRLPSDVDLETQRRIPIWWRWYYWADPIAWSLYGLFVSQYGEDDSLVKLADGIQKMPVRQLLEVGFGYKHDFLGVAGIAVVGFCVIQLPEEMISPIFIPHCFGSGIIACNTSTSAFPEGTVEVYSYKEVEIPTPYNTPSLVCVPVIDLFDSNAASLIRRACEKWGAFQITNHGIPMHLMKEADDAMEEYQKEMKGLALKLIGLMLGSLGLNYEDVKWLKPKNSSRPQTLLQLNSYPVCPDPTRAMGLAPHTDSSLLTLLNQSSISGLQVLVDGIRWVPAHPIPGALVVNVGDLMHILSNGQFKSAAHRAVVNEVHHRISMAYFYGPPMDVKISPLIDQSHPLYQPVTWKEYLDYKATHFDKALEVIRTDAQKPYQRTSDDFAFGQWPNCTC
ncbi:unnamed protein product [Malus baccata var. baccata]